MKENDRKRFLVALSKTRVSLPGINLSLEEQILRDQVFWEELEKFSIEDVEEGFKWARGELKFFPKPIELIEFIRHELNRQYLKDIPRIEWMEPTEEARKISKELIGDLHKTWNNEEKNREEDRAIAFEKRRQELKKQAKLLLS